MLKWLPVPESFAKIHCWLSVTQIITLTYSYIEMKASFWKGLKSIQLITDAPNPFAALWNWTECECCVDALVAHFKMHLNTEAAFYRNCLASQFHLLSWNTVSLASLTVLNKFKQVPLSALSFGFQQSSLPSFFTHNSWLISWKWHNEHPAKTAAPLHHPHDWKGFKKNSNKKVIICRICFSILCDITNILVCGGVKVLHLLSVHCCPNPLCFLIVLSCVKDKLLQFGYRRNL